MRFNVFYFIFLNNWNLGVLELKDWNKSHFKEKKKKGIARISKVIIWNRLKGGPEVCCTQPVRIIRSHIVNVTGNRFYHHWEHSQWSSYRHLLIIRFFLHIYPLVSIIQFAKIFFFKDIKTPSINWLYNLVVSFFLQKPYNSRGIFDRKNLL